MFKKIRLYNSFKKTLSLNRVTLEGDFNARIDKAYRIYTVVNIPDESFGEPYNLRKTDIDTIARNYINDFRGNMSKFLVNRGLLELFDLYEVRKVDKYSYLLIFGYSLLNTRKVANNFITFGIITSILFIIFILVYILMKTLS